MADGMDKAHALRQQAERACSRCKEHPPTWPGTPRQCAFVGPSFSDENYNCATMNQLRLLVEDDGLRVYGEDESLGIVRCPFEVGGFVVLSWYKDRGRTAVAQWVSSNGVWPLTYDIADAVLRAHHLI